MALLKDILYKVPVRSVKGKLVTDITNLQIDSRKVTQGSCFIAITGSNVNGNTFIDNAIANGASVIICEQLPVTEDENVQYIVVENSAVASGVIAHNFYGQPSEKLKLVGVTGTNGKTTIATLLYKLFSSLGYACGLISTVQNQIGTQTLAATHTTPDAISLNELLAKMVDTGCTHVFMEVSSHALHQHRISGLHFTGGNHFRATLLMAGKLASLADPDLFH